MNLFTAASVALACALVPTAMVCLRGSVVDRLVGLQMATIIESLVLLTIAESSKRAVFFDLGIAVALLAFGGALVFARFLERWL